MVSDEYDRKNPNNDTDDDSFASTQHTDGNRDAEDTEEAINENNESVKSID